MALSFAGKVAYGGTFLLLVPATLVLWAKDTSKLIHLPAVHSKGLGLAIALAGILLMLAGMRDLWALGGGLPMNAAPPPRYVSRGAYGIIPHPIYTGFVLACAGASVWAGSASGLWLVTPMASLCCASLVLGYEHQDLKRRFGNTPNSVLPPDNFTRAEFRERRRTVLLATIPWSIWAVGLLLARAQRDMPFWFAITTTIAFAILPFALQRRSGIRQLMANSFAAMPSALVLFFCVPLLTLHARSNVFGFVPSPVIICIFLLAEAIPRRSRITRWILRCFALLIAAYLAAAGLVPYRSAVIALAAVVLGVSIRSLWDIARFASERIANSWCEWRIGSARFIYHGLYAGAGGFLTVWLGTTLAGTGHIAAIVFASCCAVVGAALWAQVIEGSPDLLRPFGFYGGLLGGILGSLAAPLFHTSPWLILAVVAAGGLWAQALGRLRCLVQGCCHGGPSPGWLGIRYTHPRSRVCKSTPWTGTHLHPTPLYSIVWNGIGGLFLIRLWTLHVALSVIIGLYFILSGIGRFAEEGWRGEPQTNIVKGLRLYQWAAICSVFAGMLFTVIAPHFPTPTATFGWIGVLPAAMFGIVVACAMGLDFPNSNRRFSRLA
jgi:prolipoprotein diacylglyceryltransferase/protein-S-isoprenylcysteine O-methyltransferase Ste14